MDVFNSALRNPLPPLRKKLERRRSGDSDLLPVVPPVEVNHIEDDRRKKKNSRRKHRNSHLGCGTCKKRRIKCDENLPQCFNCVKGKLHCAYLNLDAPARNALRMAQYNQNLRQDRNDDPANKSAKDVESGDESLREPAMQGPVVHVEPYYQGYTPYQMVPQGAAAPPAGAANGASVAITTGAIATPVQPPSLVVQHPGAPHQPLGAPAGPAYIQSPYASMVQFQSVPSIPGYPPVAVQVVQAPLGHQVVYQNPEQLPFSPQVHMTPANIDGQPVLLMQNAQIDRNVSYEPALAAQQQGYGQPPIQISQVPQAHPHSAPAMSVPPVYMASAGQYLTSMPLPPPPPPATVGPPNIASAPASNKDLLPRIGALSNTSSIKTSPQLPVIRSVLSTHLANSDYEPKTENTDFKLPPIKADANSASNSTSVSPKVADKVLSILKLIS